LRSLQGAGAFSRPITPATLKTHRTTAAKHTRASAPKSRLFIAASIKCCIDEPSAARTFQPTLIPTKKKENSLVNLRALGG
jgi:hypothetical protein